MKPEFIDPFISTLISVFDSMLGCKVTKIDQSVLQTSEHEHDISGIIGMSGKAKGAVALCLSQNVALSAAGALLCEKLSVMNSDVSDAIGEITNIVVGSAKSKLAFLDLSISIPTVIVGKGHTVDFPRNIDPVLIPFTSDWGYIGMQIGLVEDNGSKVSKFKPFNS